MKLRAVGMNRARSLCEAAERSVGVTEGLEFRKNNNSYDTGDI